MNSKGQGGLRTEHIEAEVLGWAGLDGERGYTGMVMTGAEERVKAGWERSGARQQYLSPSQCT